MPSHFRRWFRPFPNGFVLLAPFLLYAPVLLKGEVLFWGLPALQFIPWRASAWQEQLNGLLPLWNPLNGMGAPLLANYQLAWFYPPAWISTLFQAIGGLPALAWALTLLVPLHLAWAGWGMVSLTRRLGLKETSQLISGLAFCLGGYFVARAGFFTMIWAGAWLPWVLSYASPIASPAQVGEQPRWKLKPVLILCLAMQFLAGHAQLTWYSLLLAGVWVAVGGWRAGSWLGSLKALIVLGFHVLGAAAIAAIQLAPTAEYLLQSQRSAAVDFDLGLTYSFWPWRLLTLFSPDFFGNPGSGNYFGYASYWEDAAYIGFLPLALAFTTLRRLLPWRKKNPPDPEAFFIRMLWILTGVGLLFALGKNTPIFPFLYRTIPTFSQFNGPARWLIWVVFGLSLLAGIAADGWRKPTGKKLRTLKRLTTGAIALAIGAGIAWLALREIQITFIEATATLAVWAVGACLLTLFMPDASERPGYRRWTWAVALFVFLDLALAGISVQPSVPAAFFASTHEKPLASLENTRVYISTKDEYTLKFQRFFRFSDYRPIEDWDALYRVSLPNLNLLPESQYPLVNNFDPLLPGRFSRWMNWVGELPGEELSNVLAWMGVGAKIERSVDVPDGIKVTKIPSMERIRWSSCIISVVGEDQAFSTTQALAVQADSSKVVMEGAGTDCEAGGSARITQISATSQSLVVRTEANQAGVLKIADTWYPGWTARVDGSEVRLHRANYLFMGIQVPAGAHEISLVYAPQSFYWGTGISGFALLFVVLWAMLRRHRVK